MWAGGCGDDFRGGLEKHTLTTRWPFGSSPPFFFLVVGALVTTALLCRRVSFLRDVRVMVGSKRPMLHMSQCCVAWEANATSIIVLCGLERKKELV
jgi:hypothetical protein